MLQKERKLKMINGVIFQSKSEKKYQGVEGENWYLNELEPNLEDYFCKNIEKSWYDSRYVDVCADISFMEKYIKLSKEKNIKFRILLCETERCFPKLEQIICNTKFIGFDYAYPGGSYYSAVNNDICSRRIKFFKKYQLNEYGLFNSCEALKKFIESRSDYMKKFGEEEIEGGDYVIFKLSEITLND